MNSVGLVQNRQHHLFDIDEIASTERNEYIFHHIQFLSLISLQPVQKEVGILRQFTFSSSLQRMSVIVRTLGSDHFDLFAKGAPEKIAMLSKPETGMLYFNIRLIDFDLFFVFNATFSNISVISWRL